MKHHWFTPWDNLIRFWGVEQAMMDLVLRPEMVNAAVSRWVDASLRLIDQWEALNLLALNNDNTRIGSGGYGYTRCLPGVGLRTHGDLPQVRNLPKDVHFAVQRFAATVVGQPPSLQTTHLVSKREFPVHFRRDL